MAKADKSIDPRILESAKQEFLALGYEKASLKAICDRAEVTTGALYKRYSGKEELFCAVVAGTIADLDAVFDQKSAICAEDMSDEQLIRGWYMDEQDMQWWFRYLYDRYDGVRLLLTCAEGTRYTNFQHEWVERVNHANYRFYEELYRRGLTRVVLSELELHVLLTAFWTTVFEPFIHEFDWARVEQHCRNVCRLFDWYAMFGFPKG